jgi:hypothetical protein
MPSPILIRNEETSLPFSPRASSKASSCFSSSTISIDQASEGMSCWILAMISSITLRGSRMEFAVFTMSVRIASRWVVFFRCRPTSRRRKAAASRERKALRCASTCGGGGIAAAPRAEMEVEAEPRRAAQVVGVGPQREAAHRLVRERGAERAQGLAAGGAAQLHQRPLEPLERREPRLGAQGGKNE